MKRLLRLAAPAGAALAALAFAGSAMAAYTPKIAVKNPSDAAGAAGPLTIHVEQPRTDDATFRLVLYVPQGYTGNLVPAEGATIGTVTAQAQANAISPDAVLELTGTIAGDPSFTAAEYPQAAGCLTGTGVTTPNAVYTLVLSAAGQTLRVPMYVAAITAPPLSSLYVAQLVTCLPSPYVPVEQGGATFGAKLISADFTLANVFTNPATNGDYRWSGVWTPYTVGTRNPNAVGTVETQSVDRIGAPQVALAMKTKLTKRGKRIVGRAITLSGTVTEAGKPVAGARVQLLLGRTSAGVRQVATVTTNSSGAYTRTFGGADEGRLVRACACGRRRPEHDVRAALRARAVHVGDGRGLHRAQPARRARHAALAAASHVFPAGPFGAPPASQGSAGRASSPDHSCHEPV